MIYKLSGRALTQIEDIIRYTDRQFGESQTEKYLTGLYHSFDLLVENPRMGRRFDRHRFRYVYRRHHVYYRIVRDRILIVEIRHSRQSPPDA